MKTIRISGKAQLDAALKASKKAKAGAPRANWTRDSRGRNHPSDGEAKWFDVQYAREARGEIEILDIEPAFKIHVRTPAGAMVEAFTVKADMRVRERRGERSGEVRVIDYKGKTGDTEVSRLKQKCVLLEHGVTIEWVGKYVEQKARAKRRKAETRDLIKKSKKQSAQR